MSIENYVPHNNFYVCSNYAVGLCNVCSQLSHPQYTLQQQVKIAAL